MIALCALQRAHAVLAGIRHIWHVRASGGPNLNHRKNLISSSRTVGSNRGVVSGRV
jgi:hypothetical protein